MSDPAVSSPAERVLACVREVAGALHPHLAQEGAIGMDSAFEADLGLDSLTRMELLARVERACAVSLPADALSTCETPRDLLRAVAAAGSDAERRLAVDTPTPLPGKASEPKSARTLVEVLEWHAAAAPEREHLRFIDEDGGEHPLTHAGLLHGARCVAGGLRARGLGSGAAVAIMLPTGIEYFEVFLGIVLAGMVPVPIYPPARLSQVEEHCRRHAGILANAQVRLLVSFAQARPVARLLSGLVEGLRGTVTAAELRASAPAAQIDTPSADATAFIQYTSGSTGDPKGVVLSHANLLANIRAMGGVLGVSDRDVFVSWLPLYHDMGLIGAWLGSLYYGIRFVVMSPLTFLAHPVSWLQCIDRFRGSISAGPNFAYELCLRRIDEAGLQGLDLSCWRYAFNGAEPVSADTLQNFSERFAVCGLRPEAMTPVYGLAEAALGVAFPPPGRLPLIDRISRSRLAAEGRAVAVGNESEDTLALVGCGRALPGYQLRVVDEGGHEAPDRSEGRLQFKGPSTTSGYFRNPAATRALFDGDWLESGDLAYMDGGELFITGRVKDVIIRAGRNLYPYELEQAAGAIEGVRKGCVAVFAARGSGTAERLVVVAETRATLPADRERIRAAIVAAAVSLMDVSPDEVVLAPPHSVLKTSSGKIRRAATRARYESGNLAATQRAPWQQLLSLALASVTPMLRRGWRSTRYAAWVTRAWTAFAVVLLGGCPVLQVVPGEERRFRVARACLRFALRVAGIPLTVKGEARVPATTPFVLVANHQSYLDGFVLLAALPRSVAFVVKGELSANWLARRLLQSLGCRFVERFDAARGIEDTRALAALLAGGTPLALFPEGTFRRMPGLLPFRTGAFVLATEAGVPVLPVVIRGTRSVLREGGMHLQRGAVEIGFGQAIVGEQSTTGNFERALALREQVREHILAHCGEPDLAQYMAYAEMRPRVEADGGGDGRSQDREQE